MVGGREEGAAEREGVEVEFAGREGDERGGEEEHGERCVVQEGLVGRCHCFALGEGRFGGSGHFVLDG